MSMFYSCKCSLKLSVRLYLLGNLSFLKNYVNHFRSRDNSPCANVILKCMLYEGPDTSLWVLRHFLSLISRLLVAIWIFPVAQTVKNLPAVKEAWVRSLGWKDPLEKGMTIHSSILAWRIPWTEEPGGPQSMWSQRVGHNWATDTATTSSHITSA